MPQDDVVDYFNQFAKNYDAVVLRDRDYTAFEKIPQWVVGGLPKQQHVLDLGCGTGLGAQPFFGLGHRVTGIDISPEMLAISAKYNYDQLLCQSLEQPLPFKASSFYAAILIGVMEFIQSPTTLFHEIYRVLNGEGLLGVSFPRTLPKAVEEKLGIKTYGSSEIETLIQTTGFCVQYTENFQGFISLGETVQYSGYLLRKISTPRF